MFFLGILDYDCWGVLGTSLHLDLGFGLAVVCLGFICYYLLVCVLRCLNW